MSNLPGKKRPYQDQLRYKHMVARLEKLDERKLETELLRELAKGKRWRIDAVLEAIHSSSIRYGFNGSEIFANAGRYGRLTALDRLSQMPAIVGKDQLMLEKLLVDAFQQAVIHDHYRVADFCTRLSVHGKLARYVSNAVWMDATQYAALHGDIKKIDYLISCGQSLSHALKIAVQTPNTAVAEHVIKAGADVNAPPRDGQTPLFIAVAGYKDEDMVACLLAHGADAATRGEDLLDAIAFRDDFVGIFDKLVAAGAQPTERTFATAFQQGAVLIAERHLAHGLQPSQMMLVNAVCGREFQPRLVKMCLDAGASPQVALDYLNAFEQRYGIKADHSNAIALLKSIMNNKNIPPAPKP